MISISEQNQNKPTVYNLSYFLTPSYYSNTQNALRTFRELSRISWRHHLKLIYAGVLLYAHKFDNFQQIQYILKTAQNHSKHVNQG